LRSIPKPIPGKLNLFPIFGAAGVFNSVPMTNLSFLGFLKDKSIFFLELSVVFAAKTGVSRS
jgi:hypothetical protein